MDAGGLDGLGQSHGGEDGGQPTRPHRFARPGGAKHQQIMVGTPASPSAWHPHRENVSAMTIDVPRKVLRCGGFTAGHPVSGW
jgi:hypothetical protein